jgi:activator of 2-hydroxyglutaryl-CoA dehydratase
MNDRCAAGTGKFLNSWRRRCRFHSMNKVLEEHLNASVIVPAEPDMVGAIGAALYGMDRG